MSDRRKKGFYVTGTVRYKAPYDERGVETSILSTCNNYKPRWKSNGVFFNRFFGGFVLRATLKSNFVASAMSCSIIEISLLRL